MRLTAFLNFLWVKAGLLGSPAVPAVNREPLEGVAPPPAKLNIPGPAMLLLAAAALKLNPPGAGAVHRNNKEKVGQLPEIDKHCLPLMMTCTGLKHLKCKVQFL